MALRCTPVTVVLGAGPEDLSPSPPPALSFARQPEWLSRAHPGAWAPHALVAAAALEQPLLAPEHPYDCVAACWLGHSLLVMQAAGPSRSLVALTCLPAAVDAAGPPPPVRPACTPRARCLRCISAPLRFTDC